MPPLRSPAARALIAAAAAALCTASPAAAQLIQIKTLPIADGDQFQFFPSASLGLGGVSIALRDSLLDPFTNPAKASRLSVKTKGTFFGSPTSYSVSRNAGGGRTFPLGGILRSGSNFGGLAVAIQEIDKIDDPNVVISPVVDLFNPDGSVLRTPSAPSRQNRFAFGTIGHVFEGAGVSVGFSALGSSLHDIDGVELLYAGSRGVRQHGGEVDLRLGLLKEWNDGRSMEAMLLHDRFNMTQDVSWADQFWDPNTRTFVLRERIDHNLDHTNTWGLHLGYSQPFADSGWRVGGIVTTNLMSHPKLPDYQIAQVMVIPWDPGHSAAYDFGVGIAKSSGLTTFGVDAVFEPIKTHTWGEAPSPIVTDTRTLPAGSKTTENFFSFSNAILRTGLGRDIPIDTVHGALKSIRLELGLALKSINYSLNQLDHVAESSRQQDESWMEWTRTWGFGMRFSDLELRYTGRMSTGDGRPGIQNNGGVVLAASDAVGKNFLSAPSGALSLTGVKVTTHQISVSVPIR